MVAKQRDIVLDFLRDRPGVSVLDVGGGHAQIAVPMSEAGFDVTVHGSNDSCARRIATRVQAGKIKFVSSSMFALPFPDGSFDVVTCIRLLPHCPEWPALVRELCRVAAHALVVDYPVWRSVNVFSGMLFGLKKNFEGNTRPFRLFTHGELRREIERNGFSIDRKKGQFVFPMVVHRAMKMAGVSRALEGLCSAVGLARAIGSPVLMKARRR